MSGVNIPQLLIAILVFIAICVLIIFIIKKIVSVVKTRKLTKDSPSKRV